MTVIIVILALVLVAGAALGIYAWRAPRADETAAPAAAMPRAWSATTDWTLGAGTEFAGLGEAARCDLIFAVADLRDEQSEQLLLHALDDPADAVALAAAHALVGRGRASAVEAYTREHPGERAERLTRTLALLD
jgi:hypothetical protein